MEWNRWVRFAATCLVFVVALSVSRSSPADDQSLDISEDSIVGLLFSPDVYSQALGLESLIDLRDGQKSRVRSARSRAIDERCIEILERILATEDGSDVKQMAKNAGLDEYYLSQKPTIHFLSTCVFLSFPEARHSVASRLAALAESPDVESRCAAAQEIPNGLMDVGTRAGPAMHRS